MKVNKKLKDERLCCNHKIPFNLILVKCKHAFVSLAASHLILSWNTPTIPSVQHIAAPKRVHNASSQFAEFLHDTSHDPYSGKGYEVRGRGQWSGRTSHRETERTVWINQPFPSTKKLVADEALEFHNAVWVSMISPCVWHERSYQLSQQILSRLWLISDRPQQVGACDTGRVNAELLCPPLHCSWRTRKATWIQRGLWKGQVHRKLNGCSWESHVSMWVVCAICVCWSLHTKAFCNGLFYLKRLFNLSS